MRQKRAIATQISLGVAGVRSVHVVPFSFPSDVACLVTTKQALNFVRWRRIAWNLQDWGTHCSMQLLVQFELSVQRRIICQRDGFAGRHRRLAL